MSEREQDNNKEDPLLVRLSVSGTPYTLRKEVVVETDWILSRIVDSDIPWKTFDEGRYFVDADPIAFRWALHFIRTGSLPNEALSRAELQSIESLADFLCFDSLLKHVKSLTPVQDHLMMMLRKDIEATKDDVAKTRRGLSQEVAEAKWELQNNFTVMRKAFEDQLGKHTKPLKRRIDDQEILIRRRT